MRQPGRDQIIEGLAGWRDDLERKIDAALWHYRIGLNAEADGRLPHVVDWRYVAECMAAALRGEDEDQPG